MMQVSPRAAAPYRVLLPAYHPGTLGDASTSQYVQQGAAIAATAASGAIAAIAAGTSLAIPLIGPGLAAVALAINAIMHSGCGETCVVTSQWADQAENLLKQLVAEYFSLTAPRTDTQKAVALSGFDNIWQGLVQRCSQSGTGNAGVRCISDRQRGACTWRQTTTSPLLQYPNEPKPGECWNWFNGYRDPIALDATVPDAQPSAAQLAVANLTKSPSTLLLIGAGLVLLAFAGGQDS